MRECRDWTGSLWPGSYMGPFFIFESDEEFCRPTPKRDDFPGHADPHTGRIENPLAFEGAYVTGDNTDSQAAAFTEALAARGLVS